MGNGLNDEVFVDLNEGLFDDDANIKYNKWSNLLEFLKKSKITIILVFLCFISLLLWFLLNDQLINIKLTNLSKNLSVASDLKTSGDSTVSFEVSGKNVTIHLDNNKCSYYLLQDGSFIKSSSIEFLDSSLHNSLKIAPNSGGNILLYCIDNCIEGDKSSKEFIGDKSSARYSEIAEGYLLEVHNENPRNQGLLSFNDKGEISEELIYPIQFEPSISDFQLVLPKDYDIEKIVTNIINCLDNK